MTTIESRVEYPRTGAELESFLDGITTDALLTEEQEAELNIIKLNGVAAELRMAELGNEYATAKEHLQYLSDIGHRAGSMMIESNMGFVYEMAKKFNNSEVPYVDRVQYGFEGLIEAVSKFDHERRNKLVVFAYPIVRRAILTGVGEDNHLIRLPRHAIQRKNQIWGARAKFLQDNHRLPTNAELAEDLDWSLDTLEKRLVNLANEHLTYLDSDDWGGSTVKGRTEEGYGQVEDQNEITRLHISIANCLDDRELGMIEMTFWDKKERLEVGEFYGVTHQRASQIILGAIKKLRLSAFREEWEYDGRRIAKQDILIK